MSVHSPFDGPSQTRGFGAPHASASRSAKPGRTVGDHLIESLAGGLRTTYQADPDTRMPDAFADLIARLRTTENRAG